MEYKRCWISIISHKRSLNVPNMQRLIPCATWYVKDEYDYFDYDARGATAIVQSGGLVASRNRALQDAFSRDLWCLQLSDDLRRMQFVAAPRVVVDIKFADVLIMLKEAMHVTGAYLGGVAATNNRIFAKPEHPVSTAAFILGDFMLIKPNPLRFDPAMPLKEDYDYTAQHLKTYGKVARCNLLLMAHLHDNNPGGAVDYRTDALEAQAIATLKAKHERMFVDHPKRKNQVILKVK